MASFVAQPVTDTLQDRPTPERLYLFDGALLTQDHFRDEQLYHRAQHARLMQHGHGAGTVAGLDVTYAPATGGTEVEVEVAPGLVIDRLGRFVELPYRSCLPLAIWFAQKRDTALGNAEVQAGIRAPGGGLPRHVVADVYLGFHACARIPEPAFATANADTIDAVQPSRILDGGRLDLVIRPAGDDRQPTSLVASQVADGLNPAQRRAAVRDFKRQQAWDLTRSETTPFRLAAGGAISEHIVAGNRQDGTEVLLARLVVPITPGANPAFDDTIDLSQAAFVPDQSIRAYSYSAEEIALMAANLRR